MHDVLLLKNLTVDQLMGVIALDPLTQGNTFGAEQLIEEWAKLGIDPIMISMLLISCAEQMEKSRMNDVASEFLRAYDKRYNTHLARDHAIRIGSFNFLNALVDETLTWHDFRKVAERALAKGDVDIAFECFKHIYGQACQEIGHCIRDSATATESYADAKRAICRSRNGVKKILADALREMNIDLAEQCSALLYRKPTKFDPEMQRFATVYLKYTQQELRVLRRGLVEMFVKGSTVYVMKLIRNEITEHCNDTEKRQCLNAAAKRGEVHTVRELAKLWNIPITERHWKLLLAHHWHTQPNGGSPQQCIVILRELVKYSENRDGPMLHRAIEIGRDEALQNCQVILASELGNEVGKPLTIEELTRFLRKYGNDPALQETEVTFAVTSLVKLIGLKP